MNEQAARSLMNVIEATPDLHDLDLPHMLIVMDPETNRVHTRGPYPHGLAATVAAVLLKNELDSINDGAKPFLVIPVPISDC